MRKSQHVVILVLLFLFLVVFPLTHAVAAENTTKAGVASLSI